MNVPALVLLLIAQAAPSNPAATQLAKQSHTLFAKLVDFKIKDELLLIQADSEGPGGRSIFQLARAAFPSAGRISVRHRSGSSSSSGGGGASVVIRFEPGRDGGTYEFSLSAAGGNEALKLVQNSPGQLSFEYRLGRKRVSYTQAKGKCTLKIRAGADSLVAGKPTFTAVYRQAPDRVRKYLVGVLEAFFDKLPGVRFDLAPPGKAILHLRDGALLVAETTFASVKLQTDYGTLTLPRSEIRQIIFPGAAAFGETAAPAPRPGRGGRLGDIVVVMQRFTPRGKLELDSFDLVTPYGPLRVEASDVLLVLFGPPLEKASGEVQEEPSVEGSSRR